MSLNIIDDCRTSSTACSLAVDDVTMTPFQWINATMSDDDMEDWSDEWLRVTVAAAAVTVIIIIIVLGNGLVIVAISADRRLKGVQNWFIASLAVSDLLVGMFIMPLSLANELMGYWAFGDVLCQLWLSTDVLLCTASILNLCLISLDRYWSITRAISYLRKRTPKRAMLMISVVWTTSAVICFPPLAGWARPQPIVDGLPLCVLSEEPGYVLYSIIGSFYLPLGVMAVVYLKIYLAARWRARRHLKGAGGRRSGCVELQQQTAPPRPPGGVDDGRVVKVTAATALAAEPVASSVEATSTGELKKTRGLDEVMTDSALKAVIVVTHVNDDDAPITISAHDACAASSDVCPSLSSDKQVFDVEVSIDRAGYVEPELVDGAKTNRTEAVVYSEADNTSPASSSPIPVHPPTPVQRVQVDEKKLLLTSVSPSPGNNYRTVTTCQASRSVEVQRLEVGHILPRHAERLSRRRLDDVSGLDDGASVCETDVERAKRKTARARERRATFVLGVVMISFVGCWLPFFFIYPLSLLTGLRLSLDGLTTWTDHFFFKYHICPVTRITADRTVFCTVYFVTPYTVDHRLALIAPKLPTLLL